MAGQLRELENIIERAMIVTVGETLEVDPLWLKATPVRDADLTAPRGLVEVERQTIVDVLARCRGKVYGPEARPPHWALNQPRFTAKCVNITFRGRPRIAVLGDRYSSFQPYRVRFSRRLRRAAPAFDSVSLLLPASSRNESKRSRFGTRLALRNGVRSDFAT